MTPHTARPQGEFWPRRPSPPSGSRRKKCTRPGNTRRAAAWPHPIDCGPVRGSRSAHARSRGFRPRNRTSSVTHDCVIDGSVHKPSTARRPRQRPTHDRDDTPDMRRARHLGQDAGSPLRHGCSAWAGRVSGGRRRPTHERGRKTGGPRQRRPTNSGSGWPWIPRRAKLLRVTSGIVVGKVPNSSGRRFPWQIVRR